MTGTVHGHLKKTMYCTLTRPTFPAPRRPLPSCRERPVPRPPPRRPPPRARLYPPRLKRLIYLLVHYWCIQVCNCARLLKWRCFICGVLTCCARPKLDPATRAPPKNKWPANSCFICRYIFFCVICLSEMMSFELTEFHNWFAYSCEQVLNNEDINDRVCVLSWVCHVGRCHSVHAAPVENPRCVGLCRRCSTRGGHTTHCAITRPSVDVVGLDSSTTSRSHTRRHPIGTVRRCVGSLVILSCIQSVCCGALH
jgi:hypothetical protein